jgi:hypothetical protein
MIKWEVISVQIWILCSTKNLKMRMKLINKFLIEVILLLLNLIKIYNKMSNKTKFQSCPSSSENDVVVQFLSGLDTDEDSETTYMETAISEQTNDMEFQESNKTVYATFRQR